MLRTAIPSLGSTGSAEASSLISSEGRLFSLLHSHLDTMFTRSSIATARVLRSRPVLQRFSSTAPKATQTPSVQQIEDTRRRRQRTANAWMTSAFIFGACGVGYILGSTLSDSKNAVFSPHLLPSEVAIDLQDRVQPKYGSPADYRAAIGEITDLFKRKGKEDHVSTDPSDLTAHGVSDWSYHEAELPTVVVWVEDVSEVQDLVRIANKYKVPITPFSGGTSLEGHFSSVSFSHPRSDSSRMAVSPSMSL